MGWSHHIIGYAIVYVIAFRAVQSKLQHIWRTGSTTTMGLQQRCKSSGTWEQYFSRLSSFRRSP